MIVLNSKGELLARHSLDREIHQLLAHDEDGNEVLALTLGEAENRPGLLRIDLDSGEFEHVGYHHVLYRAAMRSTTNGSSIIAFENSYGEFGWDLMLIDQHGHIEEVVSRKAHDLLPAWKPGGETVAYLAEVDDERSEGGRGGEGP